MTSSRHCLTQSSWQGRIARSAGIWHVACAVRESLAHVLRQSLHRKGALHHVQCNKPEDTVVELWNGKHGTTCKCVRVCDLVVPMSALAVEELSTRLSTAGESVASVQALLNTP